MKAACFVVLILGLLSSTPALADEKAEVAAGRLLDSMNMQIVIADLTDAALDAQLSQKPEMAPYREVLRAFFAKHMSYKTLRPKLAAVYAAEFSASELDEVAAFYATQTGKKFLLKMPSLYSKGAEIGQSALKEHIPELQEAMRVESQRLQKAGTDVTAS